MHFFFYNLHNLRPRMNVLSTAASTQCMPKVLVYYNDEISEIGNLINVQKNDNECGLSD